MDIRVVESVVTSGGLADPSFRIDPAIEHVSLDWNNSEGTLALVDYNLNYQILPHQIYTDLVKKVFLTYNGKSCGSGQLIETVVMESDPEDDINQLAGFNNSNEWYYTPSTFSYASEIRYLTNPADYATLPYDYREGFTVVKQFLTAQSNVSPGTPAYTAFYRAPHLTSFVPANVEGNRIYTDGWYTSYVCVVRTWSSVDPITNGVATGDILWYEPNKEFYINLTGVAGALIQDPNDPTLMIPDNINWKPAPNFEEWQTLMRNNLGSTLPNDPIYFVETQHLVTVDLNAAILAELKKQCGCCDSPKFNMSQLQDYMRLVQKRMGAWVQFNAGLYHDASCILESARPLCYQCLYHDHCLTRPRKSC
jgi:hypothetical protein